jgi:putative membrane-bound dehydrogenase-like protein
MKPLALPLGLLVAAVTWIPAPGLDVRKTHQVRLNGHTFTLPVGFTVELVAGPPLVDRPITADFDEQGRLYVSDSSGSNDKVEVQLKQKPHRILRLEDTDGDGKFDKRTVFADHMMFPEGTMWYAGSLYVAAPPSIWKLTDTDGDGVADQRLEWFQGKTLTGCANDLHGPYLGPDGWIYWCKGAFAQQTYERPGKPPFVTRAAHIFRCRPDGTGIEPVMTGGMDNPVDVVFTPGGERIFTTTFLQHPGGGKRDGLIHAVYGGVYGKVWDPIYEHPWTGPDVMPVLSHFGAAAPCGLVRYESRVFGPEYQDNLFACQFNLHKVSRHVLTPDGATFKSRDEDFLVSDNLDFHPTDVLEDADGSLIVVDTGGWYKLCCPTSQLHKPDVLGAIYRVRKEGTPRIEDPRGLKLAWDKLTAQELASLLDDPRPAAQRRAIQTLAGKGPEAVPALAHAIHSGASVQVRRNAVWAATRIDLAGARQVAREALMDTSRNVRLPAIHSVSVWRDRDALSQLVRMLTYDPSPACRRAAAEGLGRIGDKSAVSPVLDALAELGRYPLQGRQPDRVLEHSLIYALIEIGDAEDTAAGLKSPDRGVRRATLIALDQMKGRGLTAETVAGELASTDPAMREIAWWVSSHHPEWGAVLAGRFRDRLAAKGLTSAQEEELAGYLARFARTPAIQELLVERLRSATSSYDERRVALAAMARSGLRESPRAWISALTELLASDDALLVADTVATVRALPLPKQRPAHLVTALLAVGHNTKLAASTRLNALAAVPGGLAPVESPLFDFLRTQLQPEKPVSHRSAAADVLSRAKLNTEQLLALAESLKSAGPMEVDRLLEAFAHATDEKVGLALVAALKASPVRSALRVDAVKSRLAKYPPAVQRQAEELYAALDVDAGKQRARLEELLGTLKDGDVRRGQAVFQSPKAACSSCHAIGYLGGKLGPDLTRIGQIRSERDLLESIVFPSASFVRSYEPVVVTTKDGKVHNGLVRKDTPEEMVLATGADQEVRLARSEIEDVQPSKMSVMPAGLDQQLTPRELADLVAFLRACK